MTSLADHRTAFTGLGELRGGMGMDTREGLKTSDHQSQADVCKLSPMVPQGFVLASPSGAVEPDTESSASGLLFGPRQPLLAPQ